MFTEIFSRLFDGIYSVSNVFPVGGKVAVIEECRKWQGGTSRPSLYVVDGDLSAITGERYEELDGLYALPFYCIENLLIDENAFVEILNEEDVTKLKEEVAQHLDFSGWVSSNSSLMADLFIEYAVCFSLCPDIPTVSFPVTSLVSSNKGELDKDKVDARVQGLRNEVINRVGEDSYQYAREVLSISVASFSDGIMGYASGKDYLLPLIITRSRAVTGTKVSNLNFKLRLAMKCDLQSLEGCKAVVANTINPTS